MNTKREKLLMDIAKELRKKHNLELYKDCIEYGNRIYQYAINDNEEDNN